MTRHTVALAQHLAWQLQPALCRDHTADWVGHETRYATATTPTDAQTHLQAIQRICHQCPVIVQCDERARLDLYTGLAAGTAYRNGHPTTQRATP